MKRLVLVPLLALSIFIGAVPAQRRQPSVSGNLAATAVAPRPAYGVPFVHKTLPNGLEVIVLPDPSVPIATVELAVRNGSFTEPPEFHGLSHLYEHMFFKPNIAVKLHA